MSRTIRKEREGENCVGTRGGCAAVGGPMCFGVSACAADDSTALCGRCRREWSCLDTRAADGHTSNFARERNNGTNVTTDARLSLVLCVNYVIISDGDSYTLVAKTKSWGRDEHIFEVKSKHFLQRIR